MLCKMYKRWRMYVQDAKEADDGHLATQQDWHLPAVRW